MLENVLEALQLGWHSGTKFANSCSCRLEKLFQPWKSESTGRENLSKLTKFARLDSVNSIIMSIVYTKILKDLRPFLLNCD